MTKFMVKVEDSIYKTQIVDLCSYDVTMIPNETKPWAKSGYYYEVKVMSKEDRDWTTFMIDAEDIEAYKICLRFNITQEDYETYKRVENLIKGGY